MNWAPLRLHRFVKLLSIGCAIAPQVHAQDWPQFLGPHRNGSCDETKLAAQWPAEGPRRLWRRTAGQGFSGPIATAKHVFLFHRLGDKETVECLQAATGERVWQFDYKTAYRDDFGFDEGPRSTPALVDNFLYTMGAEGLAHCLEASSGKVVWSADLKARFSTPKGFFGMACSPLVEKNAVLLNVGGAKGAGVVALDRASGALLWKALDDEASYSSPATATLDNKLWTFFLTRSGLSVIDPSNGSVADRFPWRSRTQASIHGATPIIQGNQVFISSSYETGAAMLKFDGKKLQKIWSADDALSNHYATSVEHEGHLYGYDGRQEQGPSLVCVEWKSGKSKWRQEGLGAGTITRCGDTLLILSEKGELIRARASPSRFVELGRTQVQSSGTRAYPALANGLFVAKGKDSLVCFDLK